MTQHYLATSLRRALEKTIKEARVVAEAGASDAVRRLGIVEAKAPTYLSDEEKELRRRLRAHARALGDRLDHNSDEQQVKRLVEAVAYAHWHRMLFARFLAERGLLRHPEHNVPVTLEDCREIAQEEGASDAWAVAERYAASMLPAVFRIDDPVLSVSLDAAQIQSLHRLVTNLDDDVFQAEDSLGWTYQFWRAAEKEAVNKAGVKIGADEISAVTQLFTEPYMVRFLLHNTLGAWWAAKVLAANPELATSAADEDALRVACSPSDYSLDMLRFVKEGESNEVRWRPAAGAFLKWPEAAASLRVLDPCCGSGHFLTEMLTILTAFRAEEEDLADAEAIAQVLRDNLFGLELDGRCVQIAAFAVALTAWRIGGWQTLPLPHIAWVGAPPPLPKAEFLSLANGDTELQDGLEKLYDVFIQAPLLGSLIDPTGGDLMSPQRLGRIAPLLDRLVEKTRAAEPQLAEGAVAARGMADAAEILTRRYALVATNVPFLGWREMSAELASWVARHHETTRGDLGYTVWRRALRLLDVGGTVGAVSLQHWLSLTSYKRFRAELLSEETLALVAHLGSGAFQEITGQKVNVTLTISNRYAPDKATQTLLLDASAPTTPSFKEEALNSSTMLLTHQAQHLKAPDHVVSFSSLEAKTRLSSAAWCLAGIMNGDTPRFVRNVWEVLPGRDWTYLQSTTDGSAFSGGYSTAIFYDSERGHLRESREIRRERLHNSDERGNQVWGKKGIAVDQMAGLAVNAYHGNKYDSNVAVIVPYEQKNLSAIVAFCRSPEFAAEVRKIDKKLNVTNATFGKVPFDLARWGQIATEEYHDRLVEPYSDDPNQWLFHGHPAKASEGKALHVALARLCGYRWPAETDNEMPLSAEARDRISKVAALPDGDQDGLLAVESVAGEKPLADRLRAFLSTAFGAEWSDALERRLVAEADEALDKKQAKDGSLEAWLRDRAFRQHCVLFNQRPFLWHIWDGLKEGFSVFVHYHRFTQANLRKLTYTMLGDWLRRAKDENNDLRYEKGRELQQMLEKVLEGEAPYDIFVRWKPLAEQPLGWSPDLNDGVRMNIRPFMEVGILREQPKGIKWTKDRGNDVPSAPWYPVFKGERINDHHTTLEEKRVAREGNPEMVAAK
ncbi:SAM-dependent DNA methyltransferase [Rhizobium phaseoli]|uniref:site-specific DNA-methyltransferase (adenine-specific) n=1 Tax=Rhizobium phaseoli TaxID=396 RepID=A0A7K3UBS1_9HYPH|nr:SAM-dependent DNA methyltransferase [Rhizobium phaseoli]NEJ71116.1 SAM-dependent DNA methyltransferase [Rhizobium phaseoli]